MTLRWQAILLTALNLSTSFGCGPRDIDKLEVGSVFADKQVAELVIAAEKGDVKTIDALVQDGVDVNHKGKYNITPLLRAYLANNKDGYAALLRHKANPHIPNRDGFSVMYESAAVEDSFWLREALANGGNPNVTNEGNRFFPGETPLFRAVANKRITNVRLLIAAKANLNHKSDHKIVPIVEAAHVQAYDIVLEMLNAGADFNLKNGGGDDLVRWVSRRNETDIQDEDQKRLFSETVKALRGKGAKVELPK